jgi:hypothetical protein
MSHFSQLNGESHTYMNQAIPKSLESCSNPQSIKTRNRQIQLSSTSQSQQQGGLILFNIPPSNYSISKGTMCLKATITVTGTALGNNNAGTAAPGNTIGFQGPGVITPAFAAAGYAFTNGGLNAGNVPTLGNGYSWINRLTLYGASSSIVEQQNFAAENLNLLLMHNSNPTFLLNDGNIMMGVGANWNYPAPAAINNTSASYDVVLPLPLSVFNSATQDFPLYLINTPLTLQIDINSLARSIFKGTSANPENDCTITNMTVSNTYLIYQAVELPSAHIEAERLACKSAPFIMPCTSTLNVSVPQSLLSSYSLGLNCSSLRSAFLMFSNGDGYLSSRQLQYVRPNSDIPANTYYGTGAGVNNILFLDGVQVNSAIYDNAQMAFYGLKNALHHNAQASVIYPSPCNMTGYTKSNYAVGWDTSSFNGESELMVGQPVTTVNYQCTGLNANASYVATIINVYDVLVAFTGDGSMEVKR